MSSVSDLFAGWPEQFLANRLDELSGGAYRWRTIKNLRSKEKIPENCFVKVSPRKIYILRDAFLEWANQYGSSR